MGSHNLQLARSQFRKRRLGANTRFTIALHILTLLAWRQGSTLTSEFIAASVNTNPVPVRRLLGLLKRKQLVRSQSGVHGGWELARESARTTLLDVRRALQQGPLFAMHSRQPNPACPVGRSIQHALGRLYAEAERAVERRLAAVTLGAPAPGEGGAEGLTDAPQ
jgi:DNA-binding IscR family transcriptional regulator